MANLKDNIRSLVDTFASDLEVIFRRSALDAVSQALGSSSPAAPRRATTPAASPSSPAPSAPRRAAKSGAGGKRIRRSPAQLDAIGRTIYDYVSQNPGQRAEQIKSALRLRTNDWALPVKKLIDEGRLSAKGEKRATTYVTKGSRPSR